MEQHHDTSLISSPFAKFGIGFTAACSLIFLPPLLSWVTFLEAPRSDVSLFSWPMVLASIAIAFIIGLITAIHEYRSPVRPWLVFTRALAIPGLVMGSWHNLGSTTRLRDADKQIHQAEQQACQLADIGGCDDTPSTPDSTVSLRSSLRLAMPGAHLASLFPLDAVVSSVRDVQLGAKVTEGRFLIVVGRTASKPAADTLAARLRGTNCCPRAVARQLGTDWVVVESPEPRLRSDALKKAIELRAKDKQLRLELVPAPK